MSQNKTHKNSDNIIEKYDELGEEYNNSVENFENANRRRDDSKKY